MSLLWVIFLNIIYLIFVFLRFNFFNIKNYVSVKDKLIVEAYKSQIVTYKISNLVINVLLVIFIVMMPHIIFPNFMNIFIRKYAAALIIVGLLLLKSVLTYSNIYKINPYFSLLSLISTLVYMLVLCSSNWVQLYLILEISAYLNMVLLTYSVFNQNGSLLDYSVVQSLLISFILNFFSSIVMFSFLAYWSWWITYPLYIFDWSFLSSSIIKYLAAIIAFIKLGTGPWLIGTVNIYKGYQLEYLLVYTLNMVLFVSPYMLYLILMSASTGLIIGALCSLIIFLSTTLNSIVSVKQLFAYSTVILYIYLFFIFMI